MNNLVVDALRPVLVEHKGWNGEQPLQDAVEDMFVYSLVSLATSEERKALSTGAQLLAQIAHKHDIPITWAVSSRSVRAIGELITQWHQTSGDEVLLMLDITPLLAPEIDLMDRRVVAEDIVRMREAFPKYIMAEQDKLKAVLPKADLQTAGALQKNTVLVSALKELGYAGLWGYQWEQSFQTPARTEFSAPRDVDDDKGCPYGFFYPSEERHNAPGQPRSEIVGIPYASVAPDSIVYEKKPYESLCDLAGNLNPDEWQRTFLTYAENKSWNKFLPFVQQVQADVLSTLDTEGLEMLDGYFEFLRTQSDILIAPLPSVIFDYWMECSRTEPTYLLQKRNAGEENEKQSLFYYDDRCQLMFEEGKLTPIEMKNYVSPPLGSKYYTEFDLPPISKFRPSRHREKLVFQIEIHASKNMPYGVAVWGDHSDLKLVETDARDVVWIGTHLLFVRVDLEAGLNQVKVVLSI